MLPSKSWNECRLFRFGKKDGKNLLFHERTCWIHFKGSLWFGFLCYIHIASDQGSTDRTLPEDLNVDGIRAVASHRPCHFWSHWVQLGALMLFEGFQICKWTLVTVVMSPHCWVLVQLSGLQLTVVHKENIWKRWIQRILDALAHGDMAVALSYTLRLVFWVKLSGCGNKMCSALIDQWFLMSHIKLSHSSLPHLSA